MKSQTGRWGLISLVSVSATVVGCSLFNRTPEPILVATATYQPYGADYRGVSLGRVSQHFDDQTTQTDFGFEYFLRADLVPGGEAFETTLVLDSVLLFEGAAAGFSEEQVDSTQGAVFRAYVTRNGRFTDFIAGDSSGSLAQELADRLLRQFLPILPDQGGEAGSTWADTTEIRIMVNGLENDVRLLNEHAATEWTHHAGVRALHVRTVSDYTFSGRGTQAGREFTIDGSGRRHIHRYIGEDGRYLGMVSADTSDGEARVTDMDLAVPIHQTRIDSLTIRN